MDQINLATGTIRQLRDTLAVISTHAGAMPPAAVSSIASLAAHAADKVLADLGADS